MAHVSDAQRNHALRDALAQAISIQPAHTPRSSTADSVSPRDVMMRIRSDEGRVARGLAAGGVQKVNLRGGSTEWPG
eukprot:scaffold1895_cov123-Isochrysis_galbana.AAC.12